MKKVIVLSGPPGCGKDTLAKQWVTEHPDWSWQEMKNSIYFEVAQYYNLPVDLVRQLCTDRLSKESPCSEFNGLTGRQAMIFVAEEVIKPLHGHDYFGIKSVERMQAEKDSHGFIFSDGGFASELEPMKGLFEVIVVQIHREGHDFSNDSRSYYDSPIASCTIPLYNDGTEDELLEKLEVLLSDLAQEA